MRELRDAVRDGKLSYDAANEAMRVHLRELHPPTTTTGDDARD